MNRIEDKLGVTIPFTDYKTLSDLIDTGYQTTIEFKTMYLLPVQCTKLRGTCKRPAPCLHNCHYRLQRKLAQVAVILFLI